MSKLEDLRKERLELDAKIVEIQQNESPPPWVAFLTDRLPGARQGVGGGLIVPGLNVTVYGSSYHMSVVCHANDVGAAVLQAMADLAVAYTLGEIND